MATLQLNNKAVEFTPGMTVLQVCELAGVEVPRFCYHDRLSIAGNCRMCLVEVKAGPPKPSASCALPATDGMVVFTDSPMVKKAREGVMEFLLINHPLDCPICDQGGECDLQDQAMAYGKGNNRFHEHKRAVPDKYMGPLIQTHMTRCIHCTRCVRFITEVAGIEELGTLGRGENMEVGTYVEKAISSELSGNIIDLCPVGALLSKPYSFKARAWELKHTESIDVLDAVGSHIRIDTRGREVMRILPRLSEKINEEWLADKARFSYDGLKTQRLDRPMLRKEGRLTAVSWEEAYQYVGHRMRATPGEKVAALAGNMVDVESMLLLKEYMLSLGSPHFDCREADEKLDPNHRASYIFNTTIQAIEQADACLFIGVSPRFEAPLINTRIRKRFVQNTMPIASIGDAGDLTYPYTKLGDSVHLLADLCEGTHPFASVLEKAEFPLIILGVDIFKRDDSATFLYYAKKLAEKIGAITENWNGLSILHKAASRVGGLDIGFVPGKDGKSTKKILEATSNGDIEILYLLGADEIDTQLIGNNTFVIYQGHHGDRGAHRADVILPGAAYTEKNGTYVNTEGRVQYARSASFPPGEAKEDWKIIADLFTHSSLAMPYTSLFHVRTRMKEVNPVFATEFTVSSWKEIEESHEFSSEPLIITPTNYYMTDPISRASRIMAECVSVSAAEKKEVLISHG